MLLSRLTDKLFPPHLAVADEANFYRYFVAFSDRNLRFALWIALLVFAVFGVSDIFSGEGGIAATRFRYLIACPAMGLCAFVGGTRWVSRHRRLFIAGYVVLANVLVFFQLFILDRHHVFSIATGVPSLNFFLVVLFGFGLFPLLLADGVAFGLCCLISHTLLVTSASGVVPTILYEYIAAIACGIMGGVFITYWREWFIRSEYHNTVALSDEKERLKDALIGYVSLDALKRKHGEVVADAFGEVSVLFCDIAGFTVLSERVAPKHLIEILNRIFSAFDLIIERAAAEKVKTIGDAYMVIAGTKPGDGNHAHQLATVALEMSAALEEVARELGYPLQLRSGIHTGSLIGGIIGEKRPTYDYWGRTVNTASRLEHCSVPGRVQISEATYWRIRNAFDCEPRGEIEVRDIGRMNCYFLLGRKAEVGVPAPGSGP